MQSAEWRIAIASAIGTSHDATGSPCQDSAGHAFVKTSGDEVLIVVVSDGAGSATYSHIGSSIAVATFISDVEHFIADGGEVSAIDVLQAEQWVRRAAEAASSAAEANAHEAHEYSCTLLAAIVGAEYAAFIQVGDGAIVVSHGDDDGWSYVFWPQHGEFANTTNFIQTVESKIVAFDLASRRIDEFAIFSDGIENLVLHKPSRSVQQSFFQTMIQPVRNSKTVGLDDFLSRALRQYLDSPTICERTDDDKTLVLASRGRPVVSHDESASA